MRLCWAGLARLQRGARRPGAPRGGPGGAGVGGRCTAPAASREQSLARGGVRSPSARCTCPPRSPSALEPRQCPRIVSVSPRYAWWLSGSLESGERRARRPERRLGPGHRWRRGQIRDTYGPPVQNVVSLLSATGTQVLDPRLGALGPGLPLPKPAPKRLRSPLIDFRPWRFPAGV